MLVLLAINAASLTIICDADFLYGPRDALGEDSYVPCAINGNSIFAVPTRRRSPSHGFRWRSSDMLCRLVGDAAAGPRILRFSRPQECSIAGRRCDIG